MTRVYEVRRLNPAYCHGRRRWGPSCHLAPGRTKFRRRLFCVYDSCVCRAANECVFSRVNFQFHHWLCVYVFVCFGWVFLTCAIAVGCSYVLLVSRPKPCLSFFEQSVIQSSAQRDPSQVDQQKQQNAKQAFPMWKRRERRAFPPSRRQATSAHITADRPLLLDQGQASFFSNMHDASGEVLSQVGSSDSLALGRVPFCQHRLYSLWEPSAHTSLQHRSGWSASCLPFPQRYHQGAPGQYAGTAAAFNHTLVARLGSRGSERELRPRVVSPSPLRPCAHTTLHTQRAQRCPACRSCEVLGQALWPAATTSHWTSSF